MTGTPPSAGPLHIGLRIPPAAGRHSELPVQIEHQDAVLGGALNISPGARGLVLIAHPSAGAHLKPRNRFTAQCLSLQNLGVLQIGLVTEPEAGGGDGQFQENQVGLMAERLAHAVFWAQQQPNLRGLPTGCLGFGIGGTVALMAAGALAAGIDALVGVEARPELAGNRLAHVLSPTLLIVSDTQGVQRHVSEAMYSHLRCEKKLEVVAGSAVLADGEALEEVIAHAGRWLRHHLRPRNGFELEATGPNA